MSRNQRIRVKLILIILGIFLLAFIAIVNIGNLGKINQKKGEYIPLYRVLLLLETVKPDLKENAEFEALNTENQDMKAPEYMTYGQYLNICSLVEKEGISYPLFEKEYKEDFFLTKEDFETMFSLFLQAYDSEGKMQTKSVTVLGKQENIVPENGETLQENEVVTTEGIWLFKDLKIPTYRFRTVEMYCYDNTLITIKEITEDKHKLDNIWVMESDKEEGIRFFFEGYEIFLCKEELSDDAREKIEREQIADLSFEDGILKKGVSKTEKLNGKILNIKENSITLEEKGDFELAENFKAYRLYGTLEQIKKTDLIVGYDFTDFVVEDGKICAGLVIKEEAMQNIRVLIKNNDFSGYSHEEIKVSCDTDFTITYGKAEEVKTDTFEAGETVVIGKDSDYFKGQRVVITPEALSGKIKLLHLNRSQGIPEYRGSIELTKEDGDIFIVNEVLLEEYLYSVVPSEMPASYPSEALKAQAVCARTYAYAKMLHSPLAWYGAHVDDSTAYQVYNNIAEKAEATKAVKETAGMLLAYEEDLVGAYYYSTSCGFGTTAEVWKGGNEDIPYLQSKDIGSEQGEYTAQNLTEEEAFAEFIRETEENDFEKEEDWYRWSYTVEEINSETIEERLKKRFEANGQLVLTLNTDGEYESKKIKNIGKIQDVYVEKRNPGGVADELIIVAENAQMKVISEYNIRYVLNDGETKVIRQDGSEVASASLLPSAFCVISVEEEDGNVVGYTVTGGGYGHGVGMSQNGAKSMAAQGWNYEDILTFFYDGSGLKSM